MSLTWTSTLLVSVVCFGKGMGTADINVLVYGSTPGAIMSAVAAARTFEAKGVKAWNVTLLDPAPRLGGMCSGGLGSTDKGDPSVIGGLAHEFFVRVAQTYNATSTEPLYYLEPHVAENVFYTMLREAGVTVLRHGYIESTARTYADGNSDATRAWGASPKITAVTMANGVTLGGSSTVYIDGTYEGDLMARARVSYTYGREPISLYNESYAGRREPWAEGQAHTGGKSGDYAAINPLLPNSTLPAWHPLVTELYAAPFGSGDDKVQGYNFRLCVTNNRSNSVPFPKPAKYDRSDWNLLFSLAAGPNGDQLSRYLNNFGHPLPNNKHDLNNGGIISTDCTGCSWKYPDSNYTFRAQIVQQHKDYQQGILWTLANDEAIPAPVRTALSAFGLCKDEFVANANWPEQLYIREALRMVGDTVYTQNDVLAREIYGNRSVGCGSYNFDAHYSHRGPCIANAARDGCTMLTGPVPPGAEIWLGGEGYAGENQGMYEFPVDLLLPKRTEVTNFLNPVTPSTTHVSFATVRMEPQFMTLGHSAGVLAALAVINSVAVHDVDEAELNAVLLEGKQILSCGAAPLPSPSSFGCLAGFCIPLDHDGGVGGHSATCAGTLCNNSQLGPLAWMIMRAHFGKVVHTAGSPTWSLTAVVNTHLKKSELNSKFLPPNMTVLVPNGSTLLLSAEPVLLEEGYFVVECTTSTCVESEVM
eukprot:m.213749 g.213749  ORF g.213749 m.213749 type:complete len:702 (+) comp25566_c0_seq2:81-2186(+)